MKLYLESGDEVHPIVRANAKNIQHWFNYRGTFIETFEGIDGKMYMGRLEPKDWTPELWELYRKEGITIKSPVPAEDIQYPEDLV